MNDYAWIPGKGGIRWFDTDHSLDDYVGRKRDGKFHVGQSYSDESAITLFCKKCNGDRFYVASEEYFTAIKCVNCEWEFGIHEG